MFRVLCCRAQACTAVVLTRLSTLLPLVAPQLTSPVDGFDLDTLLLLPFLVWLVLSVTVLRSFRGIRNLAACTCAATFSLTNSVDVACTCAALASLLVCYLLRRWLRLSGKISLLQVRRSIAAWLQHLQAGCSACMNKMSYS